MHNTNPSRDYSEKYLLEYICTVEAGPCEDNQQELNTLDMSGNALDINVDESQVL